MRSLAAVFFILHACIAPMSWSETLPSFAKNYPDGLLSNDYGILTEEDLAIEAWRAHPVPLDPNEISAGYNRWQCFPVKEVEPKYRTWRDSNPMGRGDVIVTMCDLETWVDHKGQLQIYVGRRAYEFVYCRNYIKAWKKLTRGEKYVCLSGGYNGFYPAKEKGNPRVPYKLWTWDKIKSKKGCYAYFGGDCQADVNDWKKAGSPRPKK